MDLYFTFLAISITHGLLYMNSKRWKVFGMV